MLVSIHEAQGVVYEGNAEQVVVPSEEGELVLLDFHQSIISFLTKGSVIIKPLRLYRERLAEDIKSLIRVRIKYGIAKMWQNELTLLVERS
jgi:F0F1-type ATP synthase epsilon subunit